MRKEPKNTILDKAVEKIKQWKYAALQEKHWLIGSNKMKQARTLNEKELNLLLLYVKTRKYAARDRAIVLLTYWGGMRIGEVAALKIKDVLAADGTVNFEVNLRREQTKGPYGRTVVLANKLRKELKDYLLTKYTEKELIALAYSDLVNKPLFTTQKSEGFSANTLTYTMSMLYKDAGLNGCSSHSGRRSFTTNLAQSISMRTLMELMGHKNIQATARYCDVTADMKRAAVELV